MKRDEKILDALKNASSFALCPLDGRYHGIAEKLALYFSEYALVANRVEVEVDWLIFLLKNVKGNKILDQFADNEDVIDAILEISENFDVESFQRVKEIESKTNHDVKAVEMFVGEKLAANNMAELVSFVHIGCTSEDINNTAYGKMIVTAIEDVWVPTAQKLIDKLREFADKYADVPMLAHTHGQPATPTTVGKEFRVYVHRLEESLCHMDCIDVKGKFNGATGNYSAISVAFPEESWPKLACDFVENYIGLSFNPVTTQIESHDYVCHIADAIRHFNNVILDLDIDMWLYISMEYFKLLVIKDEVGSSTMPHKVNPIKFENSESNIDMSNAILTALSNKLPKSRMQRDLSDSSTQRNIGLGFGYSIQSIQETINGLKRCDLNVEKLAADLDEKWEVLAEPIQTVLRKYGRPDAYNQLKELTRGKAISKEAIHQFISSLDILSDEDKRQLMDLTPSKYVGYAAEIAKSK